MACWQMSRVREPVSVRFWRYVNREGPIPAGLKAPCWPWIGARNKHGYGVIGEEGDGRILRAPRVAWELIVGPIPKGLWALHRCDNPACVHADPDPGVSHLFLGTQTDNMRDMMAKGRCGRTSLSEAHVKEIRASAALGQPRREIAVRFGITRGTVSEIITRRTWKHVA